MVEKSIYDRIFIHQGNDFLEDMKYVIDISYIMAFGKPSTGLWASTYTPGEEFLSEWDSFNKRNNVKRDNGKYVLFKLKEEARIFELDKLDSVGEKYVIQEIMDKIKSAESRLESIDMNNREDFEEVLMNYFMLSGNLGRTLKWKEILEDFDGIYLPKDYVSKFSMWDVESLVMFNLEGIEIVEEKVK